MFILLYSGKRLELNQNGCKNVHARCRKCFSHFVFRIRKMFDAFNLLLFCDEQCIELRLFTYFRLLLWSHRIHHTRIWMPCLQRILLSHNHSNWLNFEVSIQTHIKQLQLHLPYGIEVNIDAMWCVLIKVHRMSESIKYALLLCIVLLPTGKNCGRIHQINFKWVSAWS